MRFGTQTTRLSGFEANRRNSRAVRNLQNVPDEVVLRILSYVDPLHLVRSVGPTCRRILELSRHPHLWRRLSLDGSLDPWRTASRAGQQPLLPPSISSGVVAARLVGMAGGHLRSLGITERRDAASLVGQVSARPPPLQTLELRRIPGPLPSRVLMRVLKRFPGIRRLVLRDVRRLRGMAFFRQLGRRLPSLSCLDVSHCPQFGTSALATLATSGLVLRELKAFRERGYRSTMPHATDGDFSLFCAQMKDSITVIKINAESLTNESCEMLIKCIHLNTLHLRGARGFTAQGIVSIVIHLANLTSLDLSGAIQVSSGNWAEIFAKMVAAPRIEVLKLTGCFGIDDYSSEFMNFPALHHLSLGGCFLLGEIGYYNIITKCTNLCHLDLEGTGPAIRRCLHLLPVCTPKLETLVFPVNDCPVILLAKLLLKMKHLKILDRNEPKRVKYWRDVAVDDELRMINGNQVPE